MNRPARASGDVAGAAKIGHSRYVATKRSPQHACLTARLVRDARHICYLNSASYSPLPLKTQEVRARRGRAQGHTVDARARVRQSTARPRPGCRRAADPCRSADMALIPSISYGVATAAENSDDRRAARASSCWKTIIPRRCSNGTRGPARRVLPSRRLTVRTTATGHRRFSRRSNDRVLRRSALPRSRRLHWSDGGLIDIEKVGLRCGSGGASFLIDATHSAGVLTMDVRRSRSGFLCFSRTYKWLLGPYGRGLSLRRQAPSGRHPAGADRVRPP